MAQQTMASWWVTAATIPATPPPTSVQTSTKSPSRSPVNRIRLPDPWSPDFGFARVGRLPLRGPPTRAVLVRVVALAYIFAADVLARRGLLNLISYPGPLRDVSPNSSHSTAR